MGARYKKAEIQSEWVCDSCGKCGDSSCCSGRRVIFRLGNTEKAKCDKCLSKIVIINNKMLGESRDNRKSLKE